MNTFERLTMVDWLAMGFGIACLLGLVILLMSKELQMKVLEWFTRNWLAALGSVLLATTAVVLWLW
jgi:uncharacterized membrane protein